MLHCLFVCSMNRRISSGSSDTGRSRWQRRRARGEKRSRGGRVIVSRVKKSLFCCVGTSQGGKLKSRKHGFSLYRCQHRSSWVQQTGHEGNHQRAFSWGSVHRPQSMCGPQHDRLHVRQGQWMMNFTSQLNASTSKRRPVYFEFFISRKWWFYFYSQSFVINDFFCSLTISWRLYLRNDGPVCVSGSGDRPAGRPAEASVRVQQEGSSTVSRVADGPERGQPSLQRVHTNEWGLPQLHGDCSYLHID